MKPPEFLWVAYCTLCGGIANADKRKMRNPFCPFCAQVTVVKIARYRLHTAPGSERQGKR